MNTDNKLIDDYTLDITSVDNISIYKNNKLYKNFKNEVKRINININPLKIIYFNELSDLLTLISEFVNLETLYIPDKIFFQYGITCSNIRIELFKEKLLEKNIFVSNNLKNIIISRTKFIDIVNIDLLDNFIFESRLKGYNINEKIVDDKINYDFISILYGEHNSSERYINLDLNTIINVLKLENNVIMDYFCDVEPDENGIYSMPNNSYYTYVFDKINAINENIPMYYLRLSFCLTLLSLNLTLNDHNINYYISITYLYISHWIIDDIFDKNKSKMQNKELLHDVLNSYLNIFDDIDYVFDFDKIKCMDEILIHKFELSFKTLKISIKILKNLLTNRCLKLLKQHYEKAILIFLKKVDLNIESSISIDYYTENRSLSTGCLPYIFIKYFAYADELNVSQEELIDFINEHDEIKEIETYVNLYDGFIDDYMTPIKDFREDTANLVYTVSNLNNKLGIYESSILSLEHCRNILNSITTKLNILMNKIDKKYQKFLSILSKSYYHDMFGIVIFHFHFQERYSDDMWLLKILNHDKINNSEKKRMYNEKGKYYLEDFRITLDDSTDDPLFLFNRNDFFEKIMYGDIFETKKETSQFKIEFNNSKGFTDTIKNIDKKIQNEKFI